MYFGQLAAKCCGGPRGNDDHDHDAHAGGLWGSLLILALRTAWSLNYPPIGRWRYSATYDY